MKVIIDLAWRLLKDLHNNRNRKVRKAAKCLKNNFTQS